MHIQMAMGSHSSILRLTASVLNLLKPECPKESEQGNFWTTGVTGISAVLYEIFTLPGKFLSTKKSLEKNQTQLSKFPVIPPVQDNHRPQSQELHRHRESPLPSLSNSIQFGVANATIVATVVTKTQIKANIVKHDAIFNSNGLIIHFLCLLNFPKTKKNVKLSLPLKTLMGTSKTTITTLKY